MTVNIAINCDNEAFDDLNTGNEVARILHLLAFDLKGFNKVGVEQYSGWVLRDANGNATGQVEVTL